MMMKHYLGYRSDLGPALATCYTTAVQPLAVSFFRRRHRSRRSRRSRRRR